MFYENNPNSIFSSPTLFLIQYPLYRIKNEQIFDHKSRLDCSEFSSNISILQCLPCPNRPAFIDRPKNLSK